MSTVDDLADDLPRRLLVEGLGTAMLLVLVVGSGIATSVGGAASTQLFQHAMVVGVGLAVLVVVGLPVSGAHFNPAVTLADLVLGGIDRATAVAYVVVQLVGAMTGTVTAHLLFGLPAVGLGSTPRSGPGLWASELLATAGLVTVIVALVRAGDRRALPWAVGGWIAAAIVATSSASFANPAVSVARALTDTWTGIAPGHVPAYVVAQLAGAVLAALGASWLFRPSRTSVMPDHVPTSQERP